MPRDLLPDLLPWPVDGQGQEHGAGEQTERREEASSRLDPFLKLTFECFLLPHENMLNVVKVSEFCRHPRMLRGD